MVKLATLLLKLFTSNVAKQVFFIVALSRNLKEDLLFKTPLVSRNGTGNPSSLLVPQYGSSKIIVFVWGKNTVLKFAGNTKVNEPYCGIKTEPGLPLGMIDTFQYADSKEATEAVTLLMIL